jgi:hypothetical protein
VSGADGHLIADLESDEWTGQRACALGDVSGDGRADLLIGDFCATSEGVWESGRAYVLSFPAQ